MRISLPLPCPHIRPEAESFREGSIYAIGLCVAKDGIDKTNEELIEEMAKALGHTGSQLEAVLVKLRELDAMMEEAQSPDEYNALVDKFNELHKLALLRREMLVIHREALGVFKHSFIDMFYPIPQKKRKKS
jgi:hypothetical protein